MKSQVFVLLAGLAGTAAQGQAQNAAKPKVVAPYVWSDQKAVVQVGDGLAHGNEVSYSVKTLTRNGWHLAQDAKGVVQGGKLEIPALTEGIHIVDLKVQPPAEVRFLAIAPPQFTAEDKKALERTLPRRGKRLFRGEEFTILAMGDSVTATGDYARLVAMMLARVTGNEKIKTVKRGYAGKSIDATVRHWAKDTKDIQPDLGLLMYGLNEQATFYPLDAYLEQYQWVANRMRTQFGADMVFMQPTPHIDVPVNPADVKPDSNPPHYMFRTIGFAEALRPLSKKMGIPVAETFQSFWKPNHVLTVKRFDSEKGKIELFDEPFVDLGSQPPTPLMHTAQGMWPLFPPSFSQQLHSMLETKGKGDTIHPNALGHLAMARSVFHTLIGKKEPAPLEMAGTSYWTPEGLRSRIKVTNPGSRLLSGRLEVHPLLRVKLQAEALAYQLESGKSVEIEVAWPQATKPEDLLKFPIDQYLMPGQPVIPVVDTMFGTRVYAVPAPFELPATFSRERQVVAPGQPVKIPLLEGKKRREIQVRLPDASVGALPLVQKVEAKGKTNWAVGELRFNRFGAAKPGVATIDGDLGEWEGQAWVPLGEPSQARFSSGPQDNRKSKEEAYLNWAFKTAPEGMYLAARGIGQLEADSFTLFFDPRPAKELGTAGGYYWVGGKPLANGKLELKPGETSSPNHPLKGVWKATPEGMNLEMLVPYSVFEQTSWPKDGDLGFSLWWVHKGPEGKTTHLQWSDEGHPWNSRWYGVVRRTEDAAGVPYVVRVK